MEVLQRLVCAQRGDLVTGERAEAAAQTSCLALKSGIAVLDSQAVYRLLRGGNPAGCQLERIPRLENRHREQCCTDGGDERSGTCTILGHDKPRSDRRPPNFERGAEPFRALIELLATEGGNGND